MSTATELATRAGRLAGRLGKPLTACPYDPDDQQAETLAFTRGWQSVIGEQESPANQVAATIDKHGNLHDDNSGKFTKKGAGAAKAAARAVRSASPRDMSQLKEIRDTKRQTADQGAVAEVIFNRMSPDQIRKWSEDRGIDLEVDAMPTKAKKVDFLLRNLVGDALIPKKLSKIEEARLKLANGVLMRGPDRSKWSAKDQKAAERLDKIIADGALAEAIDSGAPDALAGADRPALMKLAKERGVKVPRGASPDTIRSLLTGARDPNPAPAAAPAKAPAAAANIGAIVDQFEGSADMSSGDAEARVRAQLAGMKADELRQVRADLAAAGHPVGKSGRTKDQMANEIVRGTIGFRADARVMRSMEADPFRPPVAPPPMRPASGAEPTADELSAEVGDGLRKRMGQAAADDRIKDAMKRYEAAGDEVSRRMAERLQKNNAKGFLTPDEVEDQLADIEADRVAPLPATSNAPATKKMNAGSLGRGDRLLLPGNEVVTVRGHQRVTQDGVPMQQLTVEGPDGQERVITVGVNTPMNRLQGGAGGSGTFSLQEGEYAAHGDVQTQTAAVGDYDRDHGIKRDPLGRFGSGTRLGQVLQKRAAVGDDDEADHLSMDNGQGFDWSSTDHNGDRQLDITGEDASDADEDEDEEAERDPDSGLARLHLSKKDMKSWANTMGVALLQQEMISRPMDPDDPKTALIASLLEAVPTREVEWDSDNPWSQQLQLYNMGDGQWQMAAEDDDGDSVLVTMTTPELQALHAQVMRQVMDDNDEPYRQARARNQQAAVPDAEFAMPEQLEDYWLHDPEAVAKIRWCTRGAFQRARKALLREGVPPNQVNGAVANLYRKACGRMPNEKKGFAMSSENPEYIALKQFPSQVACGCGGHDDELAVDVAAAAPMIAPIDVDEKEPGPVMAESTSTGWRGPLAPIDIATGDDRKFAPGALDSRVLPLPFRWQERQEKGHDGAVVVGALTGYGVLTAPELWRGYMLPAGTLMGEGYFLDENIIPEVRKAKHLAEHGVIGPSVDLEPKMQVTYVDRETGNTFNPHECGQDGTCPTHGEAVITEATIAGATLVPITAFAGCKAPELFARTTAQDAAFAAAPAPACGCTQTSAVRHGASWDTVPIAPAGTAWDPEAARVRLLEWARAENLPVDEAETDWKRFSVGFLWSNGETGPDRPDTEGDYRFQIVDIIDGQPTIVPEAVFTAAARVDSAVIPSSARREVREVLEDLYGQMADAFGLDDELHAPWTREHELSSGASADCGCADKWAALGSTVNQTAAGAYGVFGDMPPYPADAFKMRDLDRLTPITIEQRPGEPFARIFGHAASWKSCNRGYRGVCVPPPRNHTGYSQFHLGAVRTDEGLLSVGKIVQGEGHPDTGTGVRIARAYYDRTSKTTAFTRAADDKFGIQLAGVIAPGVTPEEATMLLASPPSGDWKDGEMIAVLAVNVPGHVVPRATMVDGQPRNMVAAGRFWADDQHDDIAAEAELLAWQFAALDDELWQDEAATLVAALQGGE